MTFYEVLLLLHIITAIIWLGAGFVIALLVFGAEKAGDRAREGMYHRDVGWLAPRLFVPASLATLILGVLLVAEGAWELDQLWIVIALVGWLISFGLGFFYFRTEGERIGGLIEANGPGDPEADWRVRRLNIVDRAQVVLLFLIVADMVAKPTGDDTGLLVVGAIILAAAVALAYARVAKIERSAPA